MRSRPLHALAFAVSLVCVALLPGVALADQADVATTKSYLEANFAFVQSASAHTRQVETTLHALEGRIGSECANAAANSPQDTDSEQLSNELIGTMVTSADRVDLSAGPAYARIARRLRWSSASLTRTIHAYAAQVSTLAALAVPKLCPDVRSWTASGFQTLSPSTVAFDATFMNAWVAPGDLPAGLTRYETSSEHALVARTASLEIGLAELETREETTWWNLMDSLGLWP
jgi:hypothetical protein